MAISSICASRRYWKTGLRGSKEPTYRFTSLRRSWWAIGITLLLAAPGQAQFATDALTQLEMLDTPTNDLIRLSTAYVDALRDLKSAELSIQTVQRLRPSAVVTNLEVQIAEVNLEGARRKVAILRMVAEKQLLAAKNKLAIVGYLEQLGDPVDKNGNNGKRQNYVRVNDEATIKILKSLLAMDAGKVIALDPPVINAPDRPNAAQR